MRENELRIKEKQVAFQEKMRMSFEEVRERANGTVEGEWKDMKNALKRNAEEVCGMQRIGGGMMKGSEWWNEETEVTVENKKEAYET